jgi:hypothetical protein
MPFTVSHVAAVLPGYRALSRWHVFSAAVIGSMVPDFALLLPLPVERWQTHSIRALFTFCLPMGLTAFWLTQLLIKPAMIEALPDRAYARVRAAEAGAAARPWLSWLTWLYAGLAILLGAVTHLVWDGFTHEDAEGVRMFPMLFDYGPEMDGHPLQLYRWLQYGSSVLGLAVVLAALWLWWQHAPRLRSPPARRLGRGERAVWLSAYLLLPLLALGAVLLHAWWRGHSAFGSGAALSRLAVAGMRGTALSLLLVSGLLRARLAAA